MEPINKDNRGILAAKETVAIYDCSNWGMLKITGEDRLHYLHNQSTNNIKQLQVGQGCDTVFVTSTARTIDLVTALLAEDAIFILFSPTRRGELISWLERFIFPMDRVEINDISQEYGKLNLIGPNSDFLVAQLDLTSIIGQPQGNHQNAIVENIPLRIAVGNGLGLPGYTLLVNKEYTETMVSKLTGSGAIALSHDDWEQLRIEQGRPIADKELTEDYNPLEAGLDYTLSFDKGCYIGQETIARLNTYQGVKQRLWGIKLSAPVAEKTTITLNGEKVGILTSYTDTENGAFGLGYVRSKAGGAGLKVKLGDVDGEIVNLPFLIHELT